MNGKLNHELRHHRSDKPVGKQRDCLVIPSPVALSVSPREASWAQEGMARRRMTRE